MSTLKLFRASIMLAGLLLQGCDTEEKSTAAKGPKTKVHMQRKPNSAIVPMAAPAAIPVARPVGFVANPSQIAGRISQQNPVALRADDLAANSAHMLVCLAAAATLMNEQPLPLDFTLPVVPGEVIETFKDSHFTYSGDLLSNPEWNHRSIVVGGTLASPEGSSDEFVLKYASSICGDAKSLNPLVRNFLFMSAISAMDPSIVPRVTYVSFKAPLKNPAPIVKGLVLPTNAAVCLGADFRFMVMRRFGASLRAMVSRRAVGVFESISILGMVLAHLQTLHESGIVHGNIHWGHVLFENGAVALIGFDRAVHIDGPKQAVPIAQAVYMSPNERNKQPSGFGDDVYRAFELVGALLGGIDFYATADLASNKVNANWLTMGLTDPSPQYLAAANAFHAAVQESANNPWALPDYAKLSALLQSVQATLTPY